jgi:16S rRNA (cytosine1402-N4)-methyltransferase
VTAPLTRHVPILVEPIVAAFVDAPLAAASEPHWWIDCTLGGGGHTAALLERLPPHHRVLGVDRDPAVHERARTRFASELKTGRLALTDRPWIELKDFIVKNPTLGLLADLGFSSDQIDTPERGLSFRNDGPLDMRMNPSSGLTCLDLLERSSEEELEKILSEWGEERFSRRIAQAIVRSRRENRLPATTHALAELIRLAVPPPARHGRIHAATRSFQALRIAVNEEMQHLDDLLHRVLPSLLTGSRVAFLTFHSLEDRAVKWALRDRESGWKALSKKPVEASEEEVRRNSRARSAKLRIAEKTGP